MSSAAISTPEADVPAVLEERGDEPLALPGALLRTPSTVRRPRTLAFLLGDSPRQQLVGSGADAEVWLIAALAGVLHRYSQQETIAVGRSLGLAPGSMAEVVLRFDSSDPFLSGRDLTDQVASQLRSPRPWLGKSDGARSPQITIGFGGGAGPDSPGAPSRASPNSGPESGPDLHLAMDADLAGGLITYDASVLPADAIERFVGHLQRLAEAMFAEPGSPVATLPMLTSGELHQLRVDWASPSAAYPRIPLHHAIAAHARTRPGAIAVTFRDQTLTYAELEARANQLAHHLIAVGVGPGTCVAVSVEPSLDIAVCLLANFKVGATHVPLDPSYPAERLAVILDDTRPRLVITQSRIAGNLPSVPTTPVFCVDQEGTTLDAYPTSDPGVEVALDGTAFVVYTSGTTGKPKGVMLTHGNLVNYICVAQHQYGFGPDDVMPAMARFSFSITMFEILSPLVAGGRLIVLEREHVLDFRRLLVTLEQVTVLHASPSLLRRLLAFIREEGQGQQQGPGRGFGRDGGRLSRLRHVSSGGDLVSADLLEMLKAAFVSAEIFVIYGCSEISCMGCSFPVPRDRVMSRSLVGKPFPNVMLRLCDPRGNLVPVGVAGEIYFGGAGLAAGYLNRPELTREKFVLVDGERFYQTGDMGRFDADGNIEMLGRSDFQIKLRGIRIELGEIEVTLRQAPGVREAIVAAREMNSEKSLIAYLVLDPIHPPDLRDLRRLLQSKLPDYMIPSAFVVLERLPVNMNQKVDRKALPMPTPADLARLQRFAPPRDSIEEQLVDIWRAILGLDSVGIEDSFFDLGGNSLLAISLMVSVERMLGKTLPLSTLLTDPTIARMATLIRGAGEAGGIWPSVVRLEESAPAPGVSRPAIFLIHDGEGEILLYRTLALKLGRDHTVYGIRPYGSPDHPMLQTRLDDVADYYLAQILSVQATGPYYLGGLCIGGFIAFEVARRLQKQGHVVEMVALIDAAHVKAAVKSVTQQRLGRFSASMRVPGGRRARDRLQQLVTQLPRKVRNVIAYESRSRARAVRDQGQMRLFRAYIDRRWPMPRFLRHIPVRVVLRFAEREYVVPEPYEGEILLFRATRKDPDFVGAMMDGTEIDDTPYIDLFEDRHLGWDGRAARALLVHDIPGGHSSMLQEPNVDILAQHIKSYIDARRSAGVAAEPRSDSSSEPQRRQQGS